jgi:hypothetical protein
MYCSGCESLRGWGCGEKLQGQGVTPSADAEGDLRGGRSGCLGNGGGKGKGDGDGYGYSGDFSRV